MAIKMVGAPARAEVAGKSVPSLNSFLLLKISLNCVLKCIDVLWYKNHL